MGRKAMEFTDKQRHEIVWFYRKGFTVADTARRFGVSPTPILNVLREMGEPLRTPGEPWKSKRNDKILVMAESGYSDEEIAATLKISRQRVYQIIKRGY